MCVYIYNIYLYMYTHTHTHTHTHTCKRTYAHTHTTAAAGDDRRVHKADEPVTKQQQAVCRTGDLNPKI